MWTKVEKETGTYTRIDKTEPKGGQFKSPWFFSWFKYFEGVVDFYHKVNKEIGTFEKIDKGE